MLILKQTKLQRVLLNLICILLFQSVFSQQVVNTSGNIATADDHIFEYSVGIISITTSSTSDSAGFITQGILQPNIKVNAPACEIINDMISFFPNPTQDILRVTSGLDWITGYHIYTANGKLIRTGAFINNHIRLNNLQNGAYFIKLFPGCNNKFRILKVIKQ